MILKRYIIILVFIFGFLNAFAQNHNDAIRFSRQFYSATAKADAMGNSLSAMGADISAVMINPAGIAVFKRNQFSLTPNFIINKAKINFQGSVSSEYKFGFNFTNIAYVGVVNTGGFFKTFNFGLAYNSFNDYRQRTVASGRNADGSVLDYWVYNANSDRYSPFRDDLAWRAWLINYDDTSNEYWSYVTDEGEYGQNRKNDLKTKGGAGELSFSFGGNIDDKLYLGMSLGLTVASYSERVIYSENGFKDIVRIEGTDTSLVNPSRLEYKTALETESSGINAKFGFIYQPFSFLRIGGAVHTPNINKIEDTYESSLYAEYPVPDSYGNFSYEPDTSGIFTWRLQTPLRANFGAAFILDPYPVGQFYTVPMTFSIDYEFADYSQMRMRADDFLSEPFKDDNYTIKNLYKASHSLRAGAELNFGSVKLRGGYAVYTSPLKTDKNFFDGAKFIYSGGIGFAGENSYLDISYSLAQSSETQNLYGAETVYPYDPMGDKTEPKATVDNYKQFIKLTLGLRF